MEKIAHLLVDSKVPCYHDGRKKMCKKQIQEIMRAFGYDDDVIDDLNDDFCKGFGVARDIIIELLKNEYYSK